MAFDSFLKFDSIEGESTDKGHEKQIEVMSFSWGLSQTGTMAFGGGGGAGKVQFNDFNFNSNMSKASPKLFLACATGEHIKWATLSGRRAGGEGNQDYLILKMTDVMISSYQSSGAGGNSPTDAVSMAFAKIEFTYKPQNADGSLGQPVTAGWDLKANKKV
jgi:type VI secretion system secreted protein Hcp